MAQFLYQVRPTRIGMLDDSTPDEARIVAEHFEYLKNLTERGIVHFAGRTLNTDSTAFGIVVFSARTLEEARRRMEEDPAVRAGVFTAELFPYRLALASDRIPSTAD
jgi:uncharacterized protein YciI